MPISVIPSTAGETHAIISAHLESLPGPTDSFYEDQVRASNHFRLLVDGTPAALAAIRSESLVTIFTVQREWQHLGQDLFARILRTETVQAALVPSSDDLFLAHAMDSHRRLTPQAYQFISNRPAVCLQPPTVKIALATPSDASAIRSHAGDFFDPIESRIAENQIYLALSGGDLVGFGIFERSHFRASTASIGMFVLENMRGQGFGPRVIAALIAECSRQQIIPVAGCWYYNHASKRTLERAGMSASGRLFRFEF